MKFLRFLFVILLLFAGGTWFARSAGQPLPWDNLVTAAADH
ncbi:MAG: hypothetical protein RL441_906, partial [Actinomycetota bacterium]